MTTQSNGSTFSLELYESCDIRPWVAELITRMQEAAAAGTNIVNLSYSHPRGWFPNQIVRRPAIRAALRGWLYDNSRGPPSARSGHLFMPNGPVDLSTCDTEPFFREIELREYEAQVEAYNRAMADGQVHTPTVDLGVGHPRGGIPDTILERLRRRKDRAWVSSTNDEIDRLFGEANKAEAFAQTQRDRAEGLKSKGDDPSRLLAAAEDLTEKARQLREQARFLKKELGAGG